MARAPPLDWQVGPSTDYNRRPSPAGAGQSSVAAPPAHMMPHAHIHSPERPHQPQARAEVRNNGLQLLTDLGKMRSGERSTASGSGMLSAFGMSEEEKRHRELVREIVGFACRALHAEDVMLDFGHRCCLLQEKRERYRDELQQQLQERNGSGMVDLTIGSRRCPEPTLPSTPSASQWPALTVAETDRRTDRL